MRRLILISAILFSALTLKAEPTKTKYNPFTGKPDFITALTTTSVKGGSGITISTTSSGIQIDAAGSGGASTLAVNYNGLQISSPTPTIDFVGTGVSVALGGASTATVTINGGGGSNIFPTTSTTMVEIVSSTTIDQWLTVRGSETVSGASNAQGGYISTANCFLATINNTSSANNARIQMTASGTLINRNVADTSPALIVNQINTGSTGDIAEFQFGNVSKSTITSSGDMVMNGSFTAKSPWVLRESGATNRLTMSADTTNTTLAIGLGNNLVFTGPTGTSQTFGATTISLSRNISDANPSVTINNASGTATGNILNLQANSVNVATFSLAGILTVPSVVTTTITTKSGQVLVSSNTAPRMMRFSFNGNGSAVSASTSCAQMNYEGNISSVSVEGDFVSTGSISVDIKRASVDAFPFGLQSIIGAGNKPSLSSASYSTITPASWTSTRLNLGDHICGTNDSSSTLTWATVNVWITP